MAFHVGQKVVCVDDAKHPEFHLPGWMYYGDLDGLTKGRIYTVRSVYNDPYSHRLCISLEEINRKAMFSNDPDYHHSDGFWSGRFRPVVEKSTDTGMAILRKLLVGGKIEEKV